MTIDDNKKFLRSFGQLKEAGRLVKQILKILSPIIIVSKISKKQYFFTGVQTDKQNLNILTFTVHISKGMLL
jgi:hypothetical protein